MKFTDVLKLVIPGLLGLTLGIWLAVTIQFTWHFFGATFMRFQDIAEVWAACLLIPTFIGVYLGAMWIDSRRKGPHD